MEQLHKLIPTFSPQGDGNELFVDLVNAVTIEVDPYLFPARGRKPALPVPEGNDRISVDPYHFPARGRKHILDYFATVSFLYS